MNLPKQFDILLHLADAVVITDVDHYILAINETYTYLTGYNTSEIIGKRAGQLRTSLTPNTMYKEMKDNLKVNKSWSGIFTNRNKDGDFWTSSITITPYQVDGETYYVGIFRALEKLQRGQYLNERRIVKLQSAIMRVLAISCEIRDPGIEQHLIRVQEMTDLLIKKYAELMHLGREEIDINGIVSASILHDIGKSAIPEGILYKPDKLTRFERSIIEMHTEAGVEIFDKIYIELDDELISSEYHCARNIIRHHHERYDGLGYPDKLKGEDIPLEARVVSVVDVFDALTSKRPYKDRWSQQDALAFLIEQKGKQFDPKLVDAFVSLYEEGRLEHYNN